MYFCKLIYCYFVYLIIIFTFSSPYIIYYHCLLLFKITRNLPHLLLFQARLLEIHNRFYTALALNDLINEVPLMKVSDKYGASKGMLQVSCYWQILLLDL